VLGRWVNDVKLSSNGPTYSAASAAIAAAAAADGGGGSSDDDDACVGLIYSVGDITGE